MDGYPEIDGFFINFDCIFIDGLHEYHQVKKDIFNSLKFLNEGGIILLHDCLPNNYYEQATPRCQWIWNGDVWKSIVEFRTHSNLDTYVCLADEGIGLIFKRSNRNILASNIKDFKKMNFSYFYKNYKDLLNIIDHENIYKILKN